MKLATCAVLIAFGAAALGSVPAQAYTYKKLYDFCSKRECVDGGEPQAGLTADNKGHLYGTLSNIGDGLVYELSYQKPRQTWKYRRLHRFCSQENCADGGSPVAPPVVDVNGNLYGTTTYGGSGCGTIYELRYLAKTRKPEFVLLYTFPPYDSGCASGGGSSIALSYAGKAAGLAYDGTSPLYGVSSNGGVSGIDGFVFSLTPNGSSWAFADLYNFCTQADCTDGLHPSTEVTVDGSGNLFGITIAGGKRQGGVAYELSLQSGARSEQVLTNFCPSYRHCRDGVSPASPLIPDATGAFFGTTIRGGSLHQGCCGVLYKLTPPGKNWTYSIPYDFCSLRDCGDGYAPLGTLAMDASGAIYGSTIGGYGSVFRLTGSGLETLYAFCAAGSDCEDGTSPNGITMDASGNLFGTTSSGGKNGQGVAFELTP